LHAGHRYRSDIQLLDLFEEERQPWFLVIKKNRTPELLIDPLQQKQQSFLRSPKD
jgi:hypothetical protein